APEQLHGAAVTRQADIYASGVVLWELLTGQRLFAGDSEAIALARALSHTAPPPSSVRDEVPPALNLVVLRAPSRDMGPRYATAAEMVSELEAASPVASPDEVAAWVRELAKDALASRASARSRCERVEAAWGRSGRGRAIALATLGVVVAGGAVSALALAR